MNNHIESGISVLLLIFLVLISFASLGNTDPTLACSIPECFSEIAIENKNAKFCLNGSEKDLCLERFAVITSEYSSCELSNNVLECYYNVALKTLNAELCKLAEDSDHCILTIAYGTSSPEICLISEDVLSCVFSYAYFNEDESICNILKTENEVEICSRQIRNHLKDP